MWNVMGVIGLFGFLIFATYAFVVSTFLERKSGLHVFGASICLILFVTSTLLFPREKEIAEEIANPTKIYQRGIEHEKRGAFKKARVDYQTILRIDSFNGRAIEKLQLLERREIALAFLQVAKRACRKKNYAKALVKLKAAKKIAPPHGTLKDSSDLQSKIKKELSAVKQVVSKNSKIKDF